MLDASPCSTLQEAAQQIPLPASMAPGLFATCFLWMQRVGFESRQGSLRCAALMPLISMMRVWAVGREAAASGVEP